MNPTAEIFGASWQAFCANQRLYFAYLAACAEVQQISFEIFAGPSRARRAITRVTSSPYGGHTVIEATFRR